MIMVGFGKLLTTFLDFKRHCVHVYISESEFGFEFDYFQGSYLKCLHIQVGYNGDAMVVP